MKYVALLLAMFLLGCDINPSEFGGAEARGFANKITYVQDSRTGLCFALVASRKTANFDQSGMGISEVPCAAVEKVLSK